MARRSKYVMFHFLHFVRSLVCFRFCEWKGVSHFSVATHVPPLAHFLDSWLSTSHSFPASSFFSFFFSFSSCRFSHLCPVSNSTTTTVLGIFGSFSCPAEQRALMQALAHERTSAIIGRTPATSREKNCNTRSLCSVRFLLCSHDSLLFGRNFSTDLHACSAQPRNLPLLLVLFFCHFPLSHSPFHFFSPLVLRLYHFLQLTRPFYPSCSGVWLYFSLSSRTLDALWCAINSGRSHFK